MTFSTSELSSSPFSFEQLPRHVERCLNDYFQHRWDEITKIGSPVVEAMSILKNYVLNGGKRIRPMYAWVGFSSSYGWERTEFTPQAVLQAVSSLEFIQACALIHDDYIDSSDTRRGHPTVHRQAENIHNQRRWSGSSQHFGASLSILIGDMAMVWADDMFHSTNLPTDALTRARIPWEAMRTEVIGGQLLDIINEHSADESIDRAHNVNRYKTAAYTIERPLHIGAALAGASEKTIAALRAYGQDIGIAFQLRDDLLGVFGDPTITGKPAGDDLREGKRTVLIATALTLDPQRSDYIRTHLGQVTEAEDIAQLAQTLRDTGVEEHMEQLISSLTESGIAHLEQCDLAPGGRDALIQLAHRATARRT
ncbi:polyprenyl synthetase family protein [Corynebacterium sp. sy039]|uniref:polyprenyl synthetase family protein n=1 Tax=Corynebacterium sp. sy039 TaxID=2599641 RepID=UPI0011B384B4|nr:polyprenyl synthetase family protein [Corynebacterium sp. sy039]QDZ42929.1 polyprenyl synthetase family protein [Corynebacterium sp. sy039]